MRANRASRRRRRTNEGVRARDRQRLDGQSSTARRPGQRQGVTMTSRLHRLTALGQSVWIDYLSRDLIESGALARAIDEDAVVGVTSNPSIFEKALAHGHAYDEQIAAST